MPNDPLHKVFANTNDTYLGFDFGIKWGLR
jgi:hypothetical protein